MPEEPDQPPAPRPVIPIENDPDETIDAQILGDGPQFPSPNPTPAPSTLPQPPIPPPPAPLIPVTQTPSQASAPLPAIPIPEPGVTPPAPFAQVYSPPATPPPPAYYPPAYPPPMNYPPAYPPPTNYPPTWPAPVDYRAAMVRSYSRPGIITAIAVTAIIAAALSAITSFFSGCTSVAIMGYSRGVTSTRTTTTFKSVTIGAPQAVSANALSDSDCIAVVQAIRTRRALSEERINQLNAFLKEHGKLVFDDSNGGLTLQKVSPILGDNGQEPASGGKTGPNFFVIKQAPLAKLPGTLRLFDDRAIYKPEDYSPDLRSQASNSSQTQVTIPEEVRTGLDDEQIQAVVSRVQNLSTNNLNAAQSSTLTSLLQQPTYSNWLQDSSTIPGLTAQVKSAAVADDGGIIITFTMGKLTLGPQGNVVGPMPVAPAAATMPSSSFNVGWTMGTLSVDKTSCSLSMAEAVVSGLLAVYLLVIAIMSLKQNPIGRKFYLIFIGLKIISGIVAIIALSGIINSLSAGNSNGVFTVAQSMSQTFKSSATAGLIFSIFGLIYAVVILLVLTLSKTSKDYYKTAG